MNNYISDATFPLKILDSVLGKTTPIQEQVTNCKVRFIESGSLIDAEQEANKFMDGIFTGSLTKCIYRYTYSEFW